MHTLSELIRQRTSNRGPYDPNRPVSHLDLTLILEAAQWAPTAHNMQNFEIVAVDDPATISALGKIRNPVSLEFVRENYTQLSFSEDELKRKKTGILAAGFPPAWRKPDASMEELQGTSRALPTSPVMLIITYDPTRRAPASEGDFLGVISLGCATENMWIVAESLGISFHIVSSYGVGSAEKEVKTLLSIPEPMRIVYAVRLGYPVSPPTANVRVRRDLPDFVHHNDFNNGWPG